MKRWILFSGVILLGIAAVVTAEWRKVDVPASPATLLYLVADSEQELTRIPVSFSRVSDAEEISIGNELARYYSAELERQNTAEVNAIDHYITNVGEWVARHARRKLPYKFHYIGDPYLINAFALPGGHVYVGAGLLSLIDSEDELAAVLGHEIEHIDHFHCIERTQLEQALRKVPLGETMTLPLEIFEAGYSKDQELEADREGTRLAVQAGYSAAGAVRMFEIYQRLNDEMKARVRNPQEELSQVARQTLEGYFRSHPLSTERIAQVQKLIAAEGWPLRPERNLVVAYIFLTARARRELEAHRYPQAEHLAVHSLSVQQAQPDALQIMAEAQFAQAKFSDAASAYRKLLDMRGWSIDTSDAYALCLAVSDRGHAAREFQEWIVSAKGDTHELQVPMAGLELLAGNADAARKAAAVATSSLGQEWSPLWLGNLGWWFYMASDYPMAVDLLSQAVQQRPGDPELRSDLAWAQIELHQYDNALQTSQNEGGEQRFYADSAIVRAVAFWQARQSNQALTNFEIALTNHPEWKNADWIKALYSPLVARSVEEMRAEQDRQRRNLTAQR